jgi:hypothetical protein
MRIRVEMDGQPFHTKIRTEAGVELTGITAITIRQEDHDLPTATLEFVMVPFAGVLHLGMTAEGIAFWRQVIAEWDAELENERKA